jgi:hypothetical protein
MDDPDHALGAREPHRGTICSYDRKRGARARSDGGVSFLAPALTGPFYYHYTRTMHLAQPGPWHIGEGRLRRQGRFAAGSSEIAGKAARRPDPGIPG